MKRILTTLAILACFATSTAFAAGTVTRPTKGDLLKIGTSRIYEFWDNDRGKKTREIIWYWVSSSGTATISGGKTYGHRGKIVKCWSHSINSSAEGSYDIEILNAYDMDVLHSDGANLPAEASDESCRFTPLDDAGNFRYLMGDELTFSGANLNLAGDASGEFHLLFEVQE